MAGAPGPSATTAIAPSPGRAASTAVPPIVAPPCMAIPGAGTVHPRPWWPVRTGTSGASIAAARSAPSSVPSPPVSAAANVTRSAAVATTPPAGPTLRGRSFDSGTTTPRPGS